MSTEEMINEAMSMSPKDRSVIIDALLCSLDEPDNKIEDLWNNEINNRIDAIKQGRTTTIPYEEIFK